MAGAELRLEVGPEGRDWAVGLRALRELMNGRMRGELFEAIGESLVSSTLARFKASAGPDGKPWTPLKRRPRPKRASGGGGGSKPLIDTGALRRSIHTQLGTDSVAIGTDLVYAATHQYGDPKRKVSARPFLGLSDEDREEIQDVTAGYFARLGQ